MTFINHQQYLSVALFNIKFIIGCFLLKVAVTGQQEGKQAMDPTDQFQQFQVNRPYGAHPPPTQSTLGAQTFLPEGLYPLHPPYNLQLHSSSAQEPFQVGCLTYMASRTPWHPIFHLPSHQGSPWIRLAMTAAGYEPRQLGYPTSTSTGVPQGVISPASLPGNPYRLMLPDCGASHPPCPFLQQQF